MGFRTKEEVLEEIERLRGERDSSQAELADALGVDQPTVSRLLRGERGLAAAEVATLAEFFGVTVDAILREEDDAVVVFRGDPDDPDAREALSVIDQALDNYLYFEALAP